MRILFTVCCAGVIFLSAIAGSAQQTMPTSTAIPDTARHEIIQANFGGGGVSVTMRLDKNTGRIYQLAACPLKNIVGSGLCWKEMIVLELPRSVGDSTPRYQIFTGGDREKYLLLINTQTGKTWQHGSEGWSPLLDTVTLPQSFDLIR